jgi:hypothetical protein
MTPRQQARARTRLHQTILISGWVAVSVVATSLVVNRLDTIFNSFFDGVPLGLTVMVLLFAVVVLVWFTWIGTDRFLRQVRATADVLSEEDVRDQKRPYVITGISLMEAPHFATVESTEAFLAHYDGDIDDACRPGEGKDRGPFGVWQQPLRLLRALPDVCAIYVAENSNLQFEVFKRVVQRFRDIEVHLIADAIPAPDQRYPLRVRGVDMKPDYESFDYMMAAIARGLKMIAGRTQTDASMIELQTIIDITPGMKTTSVVAALNSLNRDLIFVYVNHAGRVTGFDAALQLAS